jgi:hypothetical protein
MTASEHTELLPAVERCPFDGATAHHGPTAVQHDQLHGEPYQRYRVWCPHGCASIERMNKAQAIEAWNRRPDIGPAPVDVPDIKLAIADYLEMRDEAMGFISDDDERTQSATDIHDAVQRIYAKVALPDGAEPVPVAWPDGDFVEYGRVHNIAISAYEAATPPAYRYSAIAVRKAVDAAITAALHPTTTESRHG